MSEPNPSAFPGGLPKPKMKGGGKGISKTVLGMPLWAWMLVVAAAIGIALYVRSQSSDSGSADSSTPVDDTADVSGDSTADQPTDGVDGQDGMDGIDGSDGDGSGNASQVPPISITVNPGGASTSKGNKNKAKPGKGKSNQQKGKQGQGKGKQDHAGKGKHNPPKGKKKTATSARVAPATSVRPAARKTVVGGGAPNRTVAHVPGKATPVKRKPVKHK